MKSLYLLSIVAISVFSCKGQQSTTITAENTLDIKRTDALIRIPKTLLSEKNEENLVVTIDGSEIPSQKEDSDNDGVWDTILVVADFNQKEVKNITITKAETSTSYPKMTDVYFGVGNSRSDVKEVQEYTRKGDPRQNKNPKFFQMEGPAWENDKIGFRMYFDPRNGIDIFGKTHDKPILSNVGIGELSDYHTLKDWGMDILKVGNSLGAGSIALQQGDSLIRVTGTSKTVFKTIEEGPIKASFLLSLTNKDFDGKKIAVFHKISIYKGQYFYQSDVTIPSLSKNTDLVSGIVNFKSNQMNTSDVNDMFILSSYGKQSENHDNLGMAIIVEKDKKIAVKKPSELQSNITKTHFLQLKASSKSTNTFYFVSGWEPTDTSFKTQEGFQSKVNQIALEIANPIIIK